MVYGGCLWMFNVRGWDRVEIFLSQATCWQAKFCSPTLHKESQEPRTTLMLGLWGRQPSCAWAAFFLWGFWTWSIISTYSTRFPTARSPWRRIRTWPGMQTCLVQYIQWCWPFEVESFVSEPCPFTCCCLKRMEWTYVSCSYLVRIN